MQQPERWIGNADAFLEAMSLLDWGEWVLPTMYGWIVRFRESDASVVWDSGVARVYRVHDGVEDFNAAMELTGMIGCLRSETLTYGHMYGHTETVERSSAPVRKPVSKLERRRKAFITLVGIPAFLLLTALRNNLRWAVLWFWMWVSGVGAIFKEIALPRSYHTEILLDAVSEYATEYQDSDTWAAASGDRDTGMWWVVGQYALKIHDNCLRIEYYDPYDWHDCGFDLPHHFPKRLKKYVLFALGKDPDNDSYEGASGQDKDQAVLGGKDFVTTGVLDVRRMVAHADVSDETWKLIYDKLRWSNSEKLKPLKEVIESNDRLLNHLMTT